jgi:hypothetical protein
MQKRTRSCLNAIAFLNVRVRQDRNYADQGIFTVVVALSLKRQHVVELEAFPLAAHFGAEAEEKLSYFAHTSSPSIETIFDGLHKVESLAALIQDCR